MSKVLAFTEQGRKRFLKWIKFLEHLKDEQFCFGAVVTREDPKKFQGVICHPIGWLPEVFPALCEWVSTPDGLKVHLKSDHPPEYLYSAHWQIGQEIFQMPAKLFTHLFSNGAQPQAHAELPCCIATVSREDFIEMMKQFVELVDNAKINY